MKFSKKISIVALISLVVYLNITNVCECENEVKQKYVSALVNAKWAETPLLLEASEYIYRNNPGSFWKFANELEESRFLTESPSSNNQSCVEELLNRASKYVSTMHFDLLKLSLSIRTYSPAVEMSRKLAQESIGELNCLTFVEIHGQISCDIKNIQSLIDNADPNKLPFVYQFDKRYQLNFKRTGLQKVIILLYSQLGTREFKTFHEKIVELSKLNSNKVEIEYFLRHNYLENTNNRRKVYLSGYGVELDIKSTEYKNKDDTKVNENDVKNQQAQKGLSEDEPIQGFHFNKLKQLHPSLFENLEEYRKHLLESAVELAPLAPWQMQDLSIQAAQRIIDSEPKDSLLLLEDLSQNFPVRARALSKIQVKGEIRKALKSQQKIFETKLSLEPGAGVLYLNGLELSIDTLDIFSLSSTLKKEAQLIESLHQVGLSINQIKELIYLDTSAKSEDYGVDLRDTSIQWINDLEKDSKYSYWAKRVQEMLRPTYPGMMRSIAKNFFHLVLMIDPSKKESRSLLNTVESFYVNDVPVRIGFIFVTNTNQEADGNVVPSVALYRAFNYINEKTKTPAKALSFLTDVFASTPKTNDVTVDTVIKEFKKKYPKETNLDDIFGTDSYYDEGRMLSMEYYKKVGLKKLPQVFVNGFPLSESEMESDVLEESIITKIMHLTQDVQMAIYRGNIHDSTNLLDYAMDREVIMPRLNPRVLNMAREYLQINEMKKPAQDFVKNIKYLVKNPDMNSLTLWIVCDPDSAKGSEFLNEAISFSESSKLSTRLGILLKRSAKSNGDQIKKAIFYALNNFDKKTSLSLIKKIIKEKAFNDLKKNKKTFQELNISELSDQDVLEKLNNFNIDAVVKEHEEFLNGQTQFRDSEHNGLIANGWILGPFDDDEIFIDKDFSLLENFILKIGLKQTKDLIVKWHSETPLSDIDDKTVMINSILGKYTSTEKRSQVPMFTTGFVNIKPKNENEPFYDLVVILDPLTRNAQKVSTILRVLTETANVNLIIYFNCKDKLSATPLKSFYRYVLESEIRFNEKGQFIPPLAYFHNVPQSPILTLNVHPTENWMVEAVNSPFDLDNICLKETDADGAYGEFELEHLIIEGHAYDVLSGQSPRGLQFNLGTIAQPDLYDTIVMANLGYFQLKASPGMWLLQLRNGRSKEIYDVISHENTDSESKRSPVITIVIDSFEAKVIKVKVSKKADKLNENLLDDKDSEKENSIWDSLASFTGSSNEDSNSEKPKEENVLNIFSVASGHLYERLMRIMMYTVLKNTKAKVKFWFLKNYLSPQFTKFLPYYAKQYNFDFQLVQYKWPRWLHHETEKQRIIWGYKILFLDVLFPLNIEKIIYVDADQIVRADLTELRDMDLKGAPYGYTPFCDSRKEMEGFRFWKTGYWQMHLGHRKYHISALYVVDLKKFRKIAAGDRLRGQYQGLSQDPNSLSNLDQDLPNNMIHQVNIFSLPQEWLYCDAWCSSDTLSKAKTIDLCNNPQTKEPKLEQAVRIVPEWKDYDNEIKNLMQKWHSEQLLNNSPHVVTKKNDVNDHQEL